MSHLIFALKSFILENAKAITQHGLFPPWLNIFCEIFQGEMENVGLFCKFMQKWEIM